MRAPSTPRTSTPRSPLIHSLLFIAPFLTSTACTTGQFAGGGVMGVGGVMMVGGFTTETSCTKDRPCYERGQPITSGSEETRPRSVPVGVIGAALVVGGAVMVIAFAPPPRKPALAPASTATPAAPPEPPSDRPP